MQFENFSDTELVTWLDEEIDLRNAVALHSGSHAYSGEIEKSILFYSLGVLRRLSKVLGTPLIIEPRHDDVLWAHFIYKGSELQTFPNIKEAVNE